MWLALAPIACTTILNIDGHYVAVSSAGGRPVDSGSPTQESGVVASGGSTIDGSGGVIVVGVGGANTGGVPLQANGGSTSGGANAAGGAGTGGTVVVIPDCSQNPNICKSGEKCCGSPASNGDKGCYVPSPLVGCNLNDCTHCTNTAPENATQACVDGLCAFACNPGFKEKNGACVPMTTGAGGTDAGSTGSGGSPCVPRECAGCGPAGPFGCCMPSGTCGCTWIDVPLGGRTNVSLGYCGPNILPPRP